MQDSGGNFCFAGGGGNFPGGGLDFDEGKALFWHWIVPIFNFFSLQRAILPYFNSQFSKNITCSRLLLHFQTIIDYFTVSTIYGRYCEIIM